MYNMWHSGQLQSQSAIVPQAPAMVPLSSERPSRTSPSIFQGPVPRPEAFPQYAMPRLSERRQHINPYGCYSFPGEEWAISYAKQALLTQDRNYIRNASIYIRQYGGARIADMLDCAACLFFT